MPDVRIETVRVTGRFRKDLGDVAKLANSIAELGLIHPIAITSDGRLIAGQRRLEAFRLLGREVIPARIIENLDDATEVLLRIERDENTERKAMLPEELVRLGQALEALERPKADARKAEGGDAGRATRYGPELASGHVTGSQEKRETREVVGEALGMSGTSYARAKKVVEAAEDPALPVEDRAIAQQALAEMNATGNIAGAFAKVSRARDSRLGAPQRSAISRASAQRHALDKAVMALSGIAFGLNQIIEVHASITREEAAEWISGLSQGRQAIESLINRLRGV